MLPFAYVAFKLRVQEETPPLLLRDWDLHSIKTRLILLGPEFLYCREST